MCDVGSTTKGLDQDLELCIALHVGDLFRNSSETVGGHGGGPRFVAFELGRKGGGGRFNLFRISQTGK
jgi:hypothetical protein